MSGLLLRQVLAWITVALFFPVACLAQGAPSRRIDDITQELKKVTSDTAKMRLLLSSANYYITKPLEEKKDLDSARYFLERCEQLAGTFSDRVWTARCDLKRSQLLREKGDRSPGKTFAEMATQFFRTSVYKEEYADALLELANYFEPERKDELARRIALYNEAIAIYEKEKPTAPLADDIKRLGELYHLQDNHQEAIRQLKKSLATYESINYTKVHEPYYLLGTCYADIGNYKKAIEYGLQSVDAAFASGDTFTLCTLYNRLGISFFKARHYPEAGTYFTRALAIADQHKDSANMIMLILNNANVYSRMNKPDTVIRLLKYLEKNFVLYRVENKQFFYSSIIINYCNRGQPALAKPYYEKLQTMERSTGRFEKSFNALIRYCLVVKKFREVYNYLDQFEASCKKNGSVHLLPQVYLLRFEVDSASGNLARAIRHYQQYKALEDSLFSEENTRSVNELNIEYETAKKDGELKLKEANIAVLSKQQKLQEAEIASSRVSKNIVIGGSIALAILLALIFNQYRIKKRQFVLERKSNAALITKQQEINGKNSLLQELVDSRELLIKEIHHRVKNSLQVIMSLLNTQSDYSNSEQAFLTIQESRQRLYAISLIHQKLYYTASLTLVKMDTYIPELIDFLRDGYVEKERIRFELSLQAIELDVTQALPIGLILNEGVTNSIKHAFPDKRAGTIKISFTAGPERQLTFIMEDNGIGIPADAELLKNDSMGVQLMHTLSLQLGGEITFASENGLKVIVTFKQRRPAPLVNEIS